MHGARVLNTKTILGTLSGSIDGMDTKKKPYLAYEKAFEYWETIGPSSRRSSAPCGVRSIDDGVSGAKDIDAIR